MDGSPQTAIVENAETAPRIARGAFIRLQLTFWGAFLLIRAIGAALYYPQLFLGYMGPRLALVAAYAGATTAIHVLASRFTHWTPMQRLSLVLIACAAMSFPLHLMEGAFAQTAGADPARSGRFFEYVAQFGWVFAAWAGYYFALDLLGESNARQAALARERAKANTAQLTMLRYQLNPHFLFNSLNAISTLVLEGRNSTAEQMILRLSRFLRHTIDTDASKLSRLKDEINIQRLYLEIEAARFGDRLTVQCEMEEGLDDCLTPSLMLQPVVENAIKHGVAHNAQPGWIRIASERRGDRLRFIVEDNGPGPSASEGEKAGLGLRNSRERLKAIYGDNASLTLTQRPEGGARAVFDIPLQRAR